MTPPAARFALPDGRGLAVRSYGPADGAPVLFVPGAASGSIMRFGEALLDDHGTRLVSVDRPGLGGSDPDPAKSLVSVGADLARLATHLGGPLPVVASSQGAPFALAAALAGAASRLVLASPSDEVAHPPVTAQLPGPVRALVAEVAADPAAAEARFAAFSAESFFDFVLAAYPASDAPAFDDPALRRLLRATLDAGFGQGSGGYARDTVLAMRPWGLDLGAVDVPVTLLVGADDTAHSPDRGATLTARIPTAERVVVPGVGRSLLWARPDLVLAAARPVPSPKGVPMSPVRTEAATVEANKRLAVRWLELVGDGDVDALCRLVDPTWTMEGGPPDLPPGPDGIRALFATFGEITQTWEIHDVIAEGDRVAVRATNRCVQDSFLGVPAAGVEQVFTATFVFRFANGLAVRTWRNAADLQRLLQLGARIVPPAGSERGAS